MKDVGTKEGQGSIHWTAPEVLNESPGVDYFLADVYSFGINNFLQDFHHTTIL